MRYFGKSAKNFFFTGKKSNFNFSKSGVFSEKKIKSPIGRRPFFESMSEAKCPEKPLANLEKPLANIEKPLANECGRRVHPNCDTPTLTTARRSRVVMSEWATDPKRFFDYFIFFLEMKFRWKKCAVFWKNWEAEGIKQGERDREREGRGKGVERVQKPV